MTPGGGWIGVDLDGTLALYEGWKGAAHIGEPIKAMLDRVLTWRKQGKEVRIMTARCFPIPIVQPAKCGGTFRDSHGSDMVKVIDTIQNWCMTHLGEILPITCQKDYGMITLYDDRCVAVELNTGRVLGGAHA